MTEILTCVKIVTDLRGVGEGTNFDTGESSGWTGQANEIGKGWPDEKGPWKSRTSSDFLPKLPTNTIEDFTKK